MLAAIGYTIIRYGQCWPLLGTQLLGMVVLAAIRYTVIRYGQCWPLFGTQFLGMDSADRYSVHSH